MDNKINYWLIKSEPSTWSWSDQKKVKKDMWDGVRNYQARNNLKLMKKNDLCFFYHSVKEKSIVGVVKVIKERLDILNQRVEALGIEKEELWWYLDLRKYGTVKHSGFGLGLERLILFITGMNNIRDVIPFPRTPKNAEF